MDLTNQSVEIPETFADRVRRMEVDDKIEATDQNRISLYNQAMQAFRSAKFATRTVDGKIYLVRTA